MTKRFESQVRLELEWHKVHTVQCTRCSWQLLQLPHINLQSKVYKDGRKQKYQELNILNSALLSFVIGSLVRANLSLNLCF